MVLPIILYGSQSWIVCKENRRIDTLDGGKYSKYHEQQKEH